LTNIHCMKTFVLIGLLLLFGLVYWTAASGQTISGVINSYYQVTAINTVTNTITVNSSSGLSIGMKVLIIEMKGASINNSNSSSFGNISAINDAGNYEFNYICNISGNDIMLQYQLLNSYDPTQQVQMVSVPVYGSVTIGGTVSSSAWDPVAGTGGIVVLEATNSITLNADIDVSGQGFQGGALMNYVIPPYNCSWAVNVSDYFLSVPTSDAFHSGGKKGEGVSAYITNEDYGRGKQANGGGGGNNNNTGGAGGANYGAGGNGGQRTMESAFQCHGTNPGVGGLSLSTYGYTIAQNRIFFGGGGGSGHENNGVGTPGGNGGGIIILTAPVITGSGNSILANGTVPVNPTNTIPTVADGDGGGGGGAGGTVIINSPSVTGSITAQANGANGSNSSNNVNDCTGPGGGGGAGVIWVQGASFPPAIAASVTGGSNGVVAATSSIVACRGSANSATPGATGLTQTGYVAPMNTTSVCAILPVSALKYFKGQLTADGATLVWEMNEVSNVASYEIESSYDQVSFSIIATVNNYGEKDLSFNDPQKLDGTIYYRLLLIFKDGSTSYSQVLSLTRNPDLPFTLVNLQPNPAKDNLSVILFAKKTEELDMIVYNAYGQRITFSHHISSIGYNQFILTLGGMSTGTYFLIIRGKDLQLSKRFIKTQ